MGVQLVYILIQYIVLIIIIVCSVSYIVYRVVKLYNINYCLCRSLAAGKTNKQLVVNSASFPYPDPTKVKGDPRFLSRLGELARLEAETIRSEQAKARLMLSARSRPASAKSLKSSVAGSASSNNSKSNCYTYQSNRRTSTSVSASVSRGAATIKRLNSSPAVSVYNHSTNASSSLAVSKQLSCTDLPTRTQARKVDGELDSIKEMTSKLSVTVNSLGDVEDKSKVQGSSTPPDVDAVKEGLGDGFKDQRSCSPPIVHIPAPPFKCSWSVGEGEGEGDAIEKRGVGGREKGREREGERESKSSKAESTSEDTAREDPLSPNRGPASCQNGHTPGDHSDRAVVEDDLKVTSDLGLSIDSLHLSASEEDSAPEPTVSNKAHPDRTRVDLNTSTIGNGSENGLSAGNDDISAKTLISSDDKVTEYELDTISESGSTTKRAKKKGGRRSTKLLNGPSSMQVVAASSSSTSLKGSKTVRISHKTVKKDTKRHIKK